MKIYFIRHGETDYNRKKLFQGQVDIPLNENGIEQAQRAAKVVKKMGLSFDYAFSSPLSRAYRTVEIVAAAGAARADTQVDTTATDAAADCNNQAAGQAAVQVIPDRRLIEMSFGAFEQTDFHDSPRLGNLFKDPPQYQPPAGGEFFTDVSKRMYSFLTDLKEGKLVPVKDDTVVLAGSHGAALRGMLVSIGALDLTDIWKIHIRNCTMFLVETDDTSRGFHLVRRIDTIQT